MSAFPLHLTAIYAGLMGVLLVVLSVYVSALRGKAKISFLDGGNETILRAMRAQENLTEYVPLALILMALLEWNGQPAWGVHTLGVLLLVGRLVHAYGVIGRNLLLHGAGASVQYLMLAIAALWVLYAAMV